MEELSVLAEALAVIGEEDDDRVQMVALQYELMVESLQLRVREGQLAGELSFIDGKAHTVGLRALCNSIVLSLAREDFENIIDDDPQLVYKVMRAVARSAHRIMHQMNHEFIELSNYIFKQHGRY